MAGALKFETSILSARQFEGLSLCCPTAILAQFQEIAARTVGLSPSRLANIQAGTHLTRVWAHIRFTPCPLLLGRTVYAVVVEGDLRITFYCDGNNVVTTNVGTHSIYRS